MDFLKKGFNYFTTFCLSGIFIFIIIYQIAILLPGNWFVDIQKMHYHDMCLGDQIQLITTKRDIRGNEILAKSFSELYKLDNQKIVETTIKRKADFIYQKNENEFNIEVKWNNPILEEGEYIVHETITIYPFMNIPIQFTPVEQHFNVLNCNPYTEEGSNMKEWSELTLNEQQEYVQQVSKMIESGLVDNDININNLAKDLYESSEYSLLTE